MPLGWTFQFLVLSLSMPKAKSAKTVSHWASTSPSTNSSPGLVFTNLWFYPQNWCLQSCKVAFLYSPFYYFTLPKLRIQNNYFSQKRKLILAFSFLFLLLGFGTNVEFCDVVDVLFDPLGVGLGRNGVVGVVGVPGGVWFGVEGVDVALPGVATDDWLSDRTETGGMTCVITSLPSESFFTNNAKSTIC